MIKTIFVEPEQFYLVDEFCDSEGIPKLNPNFSKVVAAIDVDTEKVVGLIAAQMVLHTEPIWINEAYRSQGIWREMAEMFEGYMSHMAEIGAIAGLYTQPTNDESRAIAKKMGFYESENPLYIKLYNKEA